MFAFGKIVNTEGTIGNLNDFDLTFIWQMTEFIQTSTVYIYNSDL